jgi:excisionase family DNA binding protein
MKMSGILPDDIQALRDALEASPDDVTVTLNLTRRSAEKVLELLEAEHSTGAVVLPVKDLFTSTEAASMLGMSRPTLMKLVDAGTVEHIRVGSHRRIPMRAIAKYQRERQTEHEEAAAALEEFRSNITFKGDL